MEITEIAQIIKTPATVIHVIAVVFGMGGALISDLLFSFFSRDKRLNDTELATLSILANVVFYSLILIALSGAAIFLSNIDKYSASNKFLAKMSILAILFINGYLLNKYIWPHLLNKKFFTLKKERTIRKLAFICGAVSVISWLAICTLGVLDSLAISYSYIMFIYFIVIACGIIMAIIVEKRELN